MTTLEYDGEEKSMADWGISLSGLGCQRRHGAPDVYTLRIPVANFASAPAFPFLAKIIVRRGRAVDGESFGGGYVAFIGYRLDVQHLGSATADALQYVFANAWYWLTQTPFQQPAAAYITSEVGFQFQSGVVLFTKVSEGGADYHSPDPPPDPDEPDNQLPGYLLWITNGKQIREILEHALEQYAAQGYAVPFIVGTIDPNLALPSFFIQEIDCASAILKCLELSPDCTVIWDYSTTLESVPTPTVSVRARANLTPASLAIGNGVDHASLPITAVESLKPSVVIIYFRITGTVDGEEYIQYARAKFGPNGENSTSDPDGGLFALIQTIDLAGTRYLTGYLETRPVYAADASVSPAEGNPAQVRAWWASVKPELESMKIRKVAFADTTILDEDDNPVSLETYPNMLLDGSTIQPWMRVGGDPVEGVRVRITCTFTYDEYDEEATGGSETATNGTLVKEVKTKVLSWAGTLTNATTGAYSSIEMVGEDIPPNLAEKVWDALAQTQYEGEHRIIEAEPTQQVTMANTLNLTGGDAAWATMAAQIQQIQEDDSTGATRIVFGPASHLNTGDLFAVWKFNRNRPRDVDLSGRTTGKA